MIAGLGPATRRRIACRSASLRAMHHFDVDKIAEIHRRLEDLLYHDWNPIGVPHIPETAGEYRGYVRGVYDVSVRTRLAQAVAELLLQLEREQMGLTVWSSWKARLPVAQKILDFVQGVGSIP